MPVDYYPKILKRVLLIGRSACGAFCSWTFCSWILVPGIILAACWAYYSWTFCSSFLAFCSWILVPFLAFVFLALGLLALGLLALLAPGRCGFVGVTGS